MQLEVIYHHHGNEHKAVATRCQGWDDDETLRQLKIVLADIASEGHTLVCVVRVDDPPEALVN